MKDPVRYHYHYLQVLLALNVYFTYVLVTVTLRFLGPDTAVSRVDTYSGNKIYRGCRCAYKNR